MSIKALCDHRVVVYRGTPTRGELRGSRLLYAPLAAPEGLNARPNQTWSGTLQDAGAGEVQGARRQWFLVPEFDVAERDVLRVVEGPESPATLRVVSVTRPTNPFAVHHLEVNVEPFTGELEEGSS